MGGGKNHYSILRQKKKKEESLLHSEKDWKFKWQSTAEQTNNDNDMQIKINIHNFDCSL